MKNKIKIGVLTLVCLCFKLFAWGENIQSIEADFEQYIQNEDGVNLYYRGKILGKIPNKAKWDYQTPFKKEIYMNNGQVIIYEPNLEQASYSSISLEGDFISLIKSAKKRDNNSYYTEIDNVEYTLFVDKNDKPEQIVFVDSMGSKSTLKLSNVKLNVKIHDEVFIFSPPQGVEIIELPMR